MRFSKFIILFLLTGLLYWLLTLPSAKEIKSALPSYEEIDLYDFRSQAQKYWDLKKESQALTLLQTAIDLETDDKTALEETYNMYLQEIDKRNSPMGKLQRMGFAFITGEVNSFEELAGSSVADFFIYGDLRDLGKELIINEHTDPFIVTLSSLGILTSIYPPADPLASMLKSAKKSNALSLELISKLQHTLKPLQKNINNISAAELQNVINNLEPLYKLGKNSSSWYQFTSFLKKCNTLKQVKFINKVIEQGSNKQKLIGVVTVLSDYPAKVKEALSFINKHGQKGMDAIYNSLRKGPNGIQFLLKNPSLYMRVAKNSLKTKNLLYHNLANKWESAVIKHGIIMEALRYITMFIIIALVFWFYRPVTKGKIERLPSTKGANYLLIVFGLIMLPFLFNHSIVPLNNGISGDAPSLSNKSNNSFHPLSILLLLIFIVLQTWSFFKAKKEIKDASLSPNKQQHLKMLELSEFYFDLPIYLGLAGTVGSFIILSIDPGSSRIIAYITTIVGILLSLFMRAFLLQPLKKELVLNDE